ncbi:hypothetical protein MHBO_004710 [Bonamia ostreae]|uniref:Uncharacterized protein n=1 Tax=Bonamia ostreae TaxID=126728 RepID=A0ABV2AU12_9EUKA
MSQPNLNFAKTTEKNSQLFEETAKLENIGQISSIFGGHFQNFSSSQKTKLNLSLLQKMLNKQTTTKNGKIKALKLYNEKMMKVNSEKKDLFEDDLEDEKEKIKDVFKDDFAHEEDVDEAEDIVKDETAADLISFDSFPNVLFDYENGLFWPNFNFCQ